MAAYHQLLVAELAPEDVEAHFVIAACENMVSERAMRPGNASATCQPM